MHSNTPATETIEAFVVISCWEENPCTSDTHSLPRACMSHTVHPTLSEALQRAEQEADFCLLDSQIHTGRRCGMLRVRVLPRLADDGGAVHCWVSDRLTELCRRAGLLGHMEPQVAVALAFEAASRGGEHKLRFLQAAATCARSADVNQALIALLKMTASLPAEAAMAMQPGVRALMPLDVQEVTENEPETEQGIIIGEAVQPRDVEDMDEEEVEDRPLLRLMAIGGKVA